MSKTIATENAPTAIGPYVQGVDLSSMVTTSGQIPADPETGAVAENVSAQAHQPLENVKAIVEAVGLRVDDIVKTTVFVKDLSDFAIINTTYEAFFTEYGATPPARSCVEVACLPKNVKIEIEAIAVRRQVFLCQMMVLPRPANARVPYRSGERKRHRALITSH